MNHTKQIAEFSIYIALAMIFSYVESLLPLPLPVPGVKLGVANLIIILALYRKNFRYALTLSLLRNFLTAFTFGNIFALLYSIAGGILSITTMQIFRKWNPHLTPLSISALGGVAHTMGQLLVAGCVVGFNSILGYLPFLYFGGLITGILIGFLTIQCQKRLCSVMH